LAACLDISAPLGSDTAMSRQNPIEATPTPTEDSARAIMRAALGWMAPEVTRFTTGLAYFVYDVRQGEDNVVLRIGLPSQRQALAESLALWARLTPLGVPLPKVIIDGTASDMPYVIMTRLPGTDLGHVMQSLPAARLTAIAQAVADAQMATARLGPGIGFGYAARPEAAPHRSWGDVVAASIDRSVRRIRANGLFPVSVADGVLARFASHRLALDALPPTPFLHDTTTKNVIVTETGDFSGIVDVDDLCFGDPRYTIALTQAALVAFGAGPLDYTRPWMERMGLVDDAIFSFYVAEFLLNFMSEHGMTFNGNQQASDPAMRQRLLTLLAQALGEAP
jgi:aminoglycoside phosphotransferase (APT) family kinase protein